MAKTIDNMTIGELERAIRQKRSLAKKAPKLRQERATILARLKEIDEHLAALGPSRAGRKPKATKRVREHQIGASGFMGWQRKVGTAGRLAT